MEMTFLPNSFVVDRGVQPSYRIVNLVKLALPYFKAYKYPSLQPKYT